MQKKQFVIRRLQESEWLLYKTLRLNSLKLAPEAFKTKFSQVVNLPDTDWQQRTNKFAKDPKEACFIAFRNDSGVGILGCIIDPQPEMIQLWVEPHIRKHGVAQLLVNELKIWTKNAGHGHLFGTVFASNKAAQKLYEKLGFIVHRKLKDDLYLSCNL